MFKSYRNSHGKDDDITESHSRSEENNDTGESGDDFVQVKMEIDDDQESTPPTLSMELIPEFNSIGLKSSRTITKFCAQVSSRSLPDDDESVRAPVDIVVALDISGSMTGNKLALCKDTLKLLLRELSPNDRFGLVTFGNEATIVIPARKLLSQNKEIALNSIQKIHTSGCTNMSGGIGLAAQELQSIESPHQVRALFLLTDGHANAGVSQKDDIVALTKNCLEENREGHNSIAVHCFGYGHDHNSDMLGEISKATEGGTYYYVESDSAVSSAFGDALGGVLSVTAQNVTLNIKVAPEAAKLGIDITKVHHDKVAKLENGSYSCEVGDFYAEESRDILFDVTLSTEKNEDTTIPIVHVLGSLSYMDTTNKSLVRGNHHVEGSILRPNNTEVSKGNNHVVVQSLRVKTTDTIKRAEILASGGNLRAARELINTQLDVLKKCTTEEASHPLIGQMKLELNDISVGLSNRQSYAFDGAYKMRNCTISHEMQRCVGSTTETPSVYRSSKKAMMSLKFSK